MKKLVSLFTILAVLFCAVPAFADGVTVTVTICSGAPVLACLPVTVTDTDGDGALTINDALACAHEAAYEGGAAAGYGSERSEYGISMTLLWGIDNGGAYGYYLNDMMAMSLSDAVNDGDRINAYVYTDTVAWSDMYTWFEAVNEQDGSVTLKLLGAGFDENWAPVSLPVESAAITLNGEMTEYVTDAEGLVTIPVSGTERLVISAVSDTMTLVSPVCVIDPAA